MKFWTSLEEILITSDVGIETTVKIIRRIEERVARDKYLGTDELDRILREEIAALLADVDKQTNTPTQDDFSPAGHENTLCHYGGRG